jgi:monoamine oxidase
VVCAVPFSTLRSVAFLPARSAEKRSVIDALPYESVTRVSLQTRERYWMREGLSGFSENDHPMEICQPHVSHPEGRIYFAGEHASSLRGWVQGTRIRAAGGNGD